MARADATNGSEVRRRQVPAPPEEPPSRWGTALLAMAMCTWVFAFAPNPIVWATVPGMVCWLALVERCQRLREVLLWTIFFGAVGIGYAYRWLAPTIVEFGERVPVSIAWLLTALFGIVGTVHGWIFAVIYRSMLRRGRRPHPLVTVVLTVGCEVLPIRLFAWMGGHGAVEVAPLRQAAAWGGVAAVSLVLYCLVVPIHEALRGLFARRGPPARLRAAFVTFLVGACLYGVGLWQYRATRQEASEATRTLRVGIVQANVGSMRKREATENGGDSQEASVAAYRRGTEAAIAAGAELVVWPETAITNAVPLHDPRLTSSFLSRRDVGYGWLVERGQETAFLVGLYEHKPRRAGIDTGRPMDVRYNDAALRPPGGPYAEWQVYRKVHLIPFGETMPLGLMEEQLPQNFKMEAGTLPQPLLRWQRRADEAPITFAPFLCYEGILISHVLAYVAGERPDVLVSLTNDSWFGDTWEPHQHLQLTRFRAVEHRAPLVRATNTGISVFLDATGDVLERLGVDEEGVLVRDLPLVERGPTLFVRFGGWLPWILWAAVLLAWIGALLRPPPLLDRP